MANHFKQDYSALLQCDLSAVARPGFELRYCIVKRLSRRSSTIGLWGVYQSVFHPLQVRRKVGVVSLPNTCLFATPPPPPQRHPLN